MRLALPDPRDALETVTGLLPRAVGLLDSAEALLGRVDALIERIEGTRQDADGVVRRTDAVITDANALVVRVAGTVASVEPTLQRTEDLVSSFAPALETLRPTLETLAETTSPEEVRALVGLVDQMPGLVESVEKDVLPMLATLRTVAPDIHDMLDVTRELNEMLAKIPGMSRMRRRAEEGREEAKDDD